MVAANESDFVGCRSDPGPEFDDARDSETTPAASSRNRCSNLAGVQLPISYAAMRGECGGTVKLDQAEALPCEFTPAVRGRPALNETSPNRHGRTCPGYPWRQSATTDGRDKPWTSPAMTVEVKPGANRV
jgi:hypothetical protein